MAGKSQYNRTRKTMIFTKTKGTQKKKGDFTIKRAAAEVGDFFLYRRRI